MDSVSSNRRVPLVADMSSDIASRVIDAAASLVLLRSLLRKIRPRGCHHCDLVLRKDLAERADKNLPTLLVYPTHVKEKSSYHTPPTFTIYVIGLMIDWIESEGGLAAVEKHNETKAKLLYDAIDSGKFYSCPIENSSRSKMNVVFRVAGGDEKVEKTFAQDAEAARIVGTVGHRSVGGMRVSLYNAVSLESVQTLINFHAGIRTHARLANLRAGEHLLKCHLKYQDAAILKGSDSAASF